MRIVALLEHGSEDICGFICRNMILGRAEVESVLLINSWLDWTVL
jgi:hypothetical protein